MRPMLLLTAFPALLLLASQALGAAWNGQPFSADVVTSSSRAGGQEMTSKVYVDRPGMRMEQTSFGQQTVVLVRFGQQSTAMIMPAQKAYMEMPHGAGAGMMAAQMGDGPCGGYERATELGTESLQGRDAEKWRCEGPKIPQMPPSTTIWYDPALQFVILQESGPGDRFELRNIVEGAQPAALFQVPAGYTKMELPAMPAAGAEGG